MTTESIPISSGKRDGNRRRVVWVALWLAAVFVASVIDRPVASWVRNAGMDAAIRGKMLTQIVKFPGTFWFTLIVAGICFFAKLFCAREAIFVIFAGVMSGINEAIKWLVGRTRPFKLTGPDQPDPFHFEPLWHGINGLVHQKDLCFPSGHACTAFALAMAIALVRPKWALFFFVLAMMVGAERVLENAHYFSDVIGAVGIGTGGTLLVHRLMRRRTETQPKVDS